MISLKELNPHSYPTTPEIDANLAILLDKLNKIRISWAKPMIITSGLRSEADQLRINPAALKSNHRIGAAADISDPKLELTAWLKGPGAALVEELNVYFEEGNKNWVHCQIFAPRSKNRWFLP
jgi:hypothetical protein